MKNLKIIAVSALLASSFAFGADAKAVADKSFALDKEASVLMSKLGKICEQKHALMMDATKGMSDDEAKKFRKDYKYEMRQNMAKLGKDEEFYPSACKVFMKGAKKQKCVGQDCPAKKPRGANAPGMGAGANAQ